MTLRLLRGFGVGIAGLLLAACAPSAPDDSAQAGGSDAGGASVEASDTFPVTVENCGRQVTIEHKPTRVVGMDGAAETLFALGAGEQTAGYFGGAPEDLPGELGAGARKSEHLGSTFPFPSAEQVLEATPDLVVLYGFGDSGDLAERLDAQEIPYLQLSESCENPDHTVEGYFGDVETIAKALGRGAVGEKLVDDWTSDLPIRSEQVPSDAPTVVVYGNQDPSKPFVSGEGSFVQDQLDHAGGVNAYADQSKGYLSPSWEDVAGREPDIIVSGGGGGEETRQDIEDYLTSNAALAEMPAVRNDRIITLDYAKNVPGPQAVEGIKELHAAIDAAS